MLNSNSEGLHAMIEDTDQSSWSIEFALALFVTVVAIVADVAVVSFVAVFFMKLRSNFSSEAKECMYFTFFHAIIEMVSRSFSPSF